MITLHTYRDSPSIFHILFQSLNNYLTGYGWQLLVIGIDVPRDDFIFLISTASLSPFITTRFKVSTLDNFPSFVNCHADSQDHLNIQHMEGYSFDILSLPII